MAFLVDLFTPSDILHIVSIANKYKMLATDDKRYLIAFRMSASWVDGSYQAADDKKQRFAGVFSRFLHELGSGQSCDNPDCAVCERLQALRSDFHGAQTSPEFALFLAWFQGAGASELPADIPADIPASEPAEIPLPVATAIVTGAFDHIPLFQCNTRHPALLNFAGLLARDSALLDADDLRRHYQAVCQAGERLLGLLGLDAGIADSPVSSMQA